VSAKRQYFACRRSGIAAMLRALRRWSFLMPLRLLAGAALTLGLILSTVHAEQPPAKTSHGIDRGEWNARRKPFRIYGNTWYVGPYGLSSILVDTGQGLALFDGDLPESAPVIEANIRALGFHVRDVKWILNSHAHSDHAGGIAALQRDSGAQVLASADGAHEMALGGADREDPQYGDSPDYPPVRHVRVVRDGEIVRLGGMAITAHYTPGHTQGSTSWTWTSCAGGRCLHMAYADSLAAIGAPGSVSVTIRVASSHFTRRSLPWPRCLATSCSPRTLMPAASGKRWRGASRIRIPLR
jgi:Zn-dependent hydrolases, including glyoxylases